ncbi:NADH dehydrogenase [ubiquinone] 1 alpha subcomplex subunit 5-like isoform X3 [Hypanus sabinus]|uniref:NADH dehydrogenase [ubiquinone] 1 alpha subcomplex subunit 5-like isoform X3 n=1 Tax=Hypanus sabinus TaxID=79690 RepID=UPI0028C3D783|nr:NADH dehydrogenase [ubiquinone] 1 alpha subcomplex subunit 5-like isoform X3 [Hypanus sabinus]
MAGVLKKTTGLVGLAVAQNPLEQLKILYTRVLTVLESIPPEAAYRKYTEQIINERFNMIKTAESELSLAKKMAKWKPWEPLIEEAPHNQWKWPI